MKNLGIILFVLMVFQCDTKCPTPDKPEIVPTNSRWIGGCDGGYWVEMVDSLSRIRIYHETSGELEMDADFVPDKDCAIKNLKQGQMTSVDPEQVIIKIGEHQYCKFDVKLPAYGGSSWNLIKEKE